MSSFEFAMGLVSILIGLAIGDMGMSVHRLIRHAASVRWDSRVILSSLLVFVTIFSLWFQLWALRQDALPLGYFFFLSMIVEMFVVFLLAASCLPDESGAGYDLVSFYEENSKRLWVLFTLFHFSFLSHWLLFVTAEHLWSRIGVFQVAVPLTPIAGGALLSMVRSRASHIGLIAALLAFALWRSSGMTLAV